MELEEEQRRRVQTRRRGRTDEQEKGGEIQGRGVLFEKKMMSFMPQKKIQSFYGQHPQLPKSSGYIVLLVSLMLMFLNLTSTLTHSFI